MSKVFEFQSNEEVVVEVVTESACEIHMVEVMITTISFLKVLHCIPKIWILFT